MGLNFFKWIFDAVTGESKKTKIDVRTVSQRIASEIYIRELAFNMMVNKIGNALSKCEINVYRDKKRVKDAEWYRWNIQPNKNQNGTQFIHKLVDKLYKNNECLVIAHNGELYVADDYTYDDSKALLEHTFEGVIVNDFTFQKVFRMSEVFFFKLNNKDVKSLLDGTLSLYGKLINASMSNFLTSNGRKGTLKIDQYNMQDDDFEDTLNEMLNEEFKNFFNSTNAVLPLYDGYDYKELDSNSTTSRDFKALLDDVISITASALNIPNSIANGNVQDTSKAIDELLTFCLDPLIELLTDEINRKNYTMEQILNGTYIKFDTKAVKHIDLLDVATAIDKLISSGCFTINDIRRVCGEDEIDEPWANQFFMTKNYATIESLMNQLKGGE